MYRPRHADLNADTRTHIVWTLCNVINLKEDTWFLKVYVITIHNSEFSWRYELAMSSNLGLERWLIYTRNTCSDLDVVTFHLKWQAGVLGSLLFMDAWVIMVARNILY